MNPISAIRMPAGPEMGAEFLSRAAESLSAKKASGGEMEKIAGASLPQQTVPAGGAPGASFSNLLGRMVQEVNTKQAAAGEAVGGLLSGEGVSLHQAVIAMEEASVSFQLMVEVRNKLLESYQELMRMQI